jgi:hypothetical protein
MEKNVSPSKSAIVFGVLFGLIMVLEFILLYLIGIESLLNSSAKNIVDVANYLVLPISFIYFGCYNYKTNINNNFISLSESIKIGLLICIIAAIIYSTFNVIFNLIFPEFADNMISILKSSMIAQNPNMKSEQIEMGLSVVKKIMNPYVAFPITLAMFSLIGLIYSLIIGAIVKKEKP